MFSNILVANRREIACFGPGTNLVDAAGEVLKLLGHNMPPVEEAAE
jgi:methylmalonyl-CoA mutase